MHESLRESEWNVMKLYFGKIEDQVTVAGTSISPSTGQLSPLIYGIGALIIGLVLARWMWVLFAPHVLNLLPPKPDTSGNSSAGLFGLSRASEVKGTLGGASLSGMHLIGVFTGKQGFAVFRLDDEHQLGVASGKEISTGIRLVEVASDSVLLEFNGIKQRLEMENKFSHNKYLAAASEPSSTVERSESIVKGWNQARQEIQNGTASANAH